MKTALLKLFRNVSGSRGIRLNKKLITFLVCISISAFFWLLSTLSKDYVTTITFPVKYVNLPKDKVVANELVKSVDIELRANGFNLLAFQIKEKILPVKIDLKNSRPVKNFDPNYYYMVVRSEFNRISKQMDQQVRILEMDPDTLFFYFVPRIYKTVPVRASVKMNFEKQYQLADSIGIHPPSIKISGADRDLASVQHVETEKIILDKLDKTVTKKARLIRIKNIDIPVKSVDVTIPVTRFTEGSIELPIKVENLPSGYQLKTFPDKVTVKYLVNYENYGKIHENLFEAGVDFKKTEAGTNKLKVEIIRFPPNIKVVKYTPDKVEYIIRK